jgi:hypothetical protein
VAAKVIYGRITTAFSPHFLAPKNPAQAVKERLKILLSPALAANPSLQALKNAVLTF